MTALVSALAAGVAVWLVLSGGGLLQRPLRSVVAPAHPGTVGDGEETAPRLSRWLGLRPTAAVAAVVGGAAVLLDGTALALVLIGTGASAATWRLVVRSRRRRDAARRSAAVVEVCEALAGELRAGQPPSVALGRCVEVWPHLDAVASAAELGSDVPRALRRLARMPGASGLGEVAAAWQVSAAVGGTMASALSTVADSARRRQATQRLVAAELASAQATARLVALLPVGVLGVGSGLGGDPWEFLLRSPPGLVCLGLGVGLALAGLGWMERIASRAGDP